MPGSQIYNLFSRNVNAFDCKIKEIRNFSKFLKFIFDIPTFEDFIVFHTKYKVTLTVEYAGM